MTTKPPQLLIVDDDEAGRFVKVQTLRRAGFHVIQAGTGAEGIHAVATARPDLVVLDVNLPDISGLEVCRRIRADFPDPPTVQILQVSSTAVSPQDQVRGLEVGADVYLTEPVAPEVLIATVRALLRVRQAEVALAAAVERERAARTQAEEATRLRDEFIALLSHELRTPLNAVMGWIWQLRHSSIRPETHARALDSLERNARLQVQLISDLLDVSRIAKGKLLLELTRLDLRAVVADALESVSEQAQRKGLQLVVSGTTSTVIADYGRLQQIVINLLTNAIQFTPERGTITVDMAADHDTAMLSVHDTGLGIEPEMLASVFDQFQQGPAGQARKHGGLGLGLAVVRQLTELHDGAIGVESAGRGRGASFRLRLPRESGSSRPDPGRRPVLAGLRIGIAMQDAASGEAVKAALEMSGAETILCEGGLPEPAARTAVLVFVSDRAAAGGTAGDAGGAGTGRDDVLHVTVPVQQARLVRSIARIAQARPQDVHQ